MNSTHEQRRIAALAAEYRKQGYAVQLAPTPAALPFSLGNYQPDLLAEKSGEHLLITVRTSAAPVSIGRLREVAETVKKHHDWRFLLVTMGQEPEDTLLPQEPLSWPAIAERISQAKRLREAGASEAAVLLFWSALEALLRRHAESVDLPLEYASAWALLDYLYSDADLSYEHFAQARKLLAARNKLAQGFPIPEASQQAAELQSLLDELAAEWQPDRQAA